MGTASLPVSAGNEIPGQKVARALRFQPFASFLIGDVDLTVLISLIPLTLAPLVTSPLFL